MVSLCKLGAGQTGVVKAVGGGHGFVQRLAEMGISMGTHLRAISGRGPMIVEVKGHRLVIGLGMVDRIQVEPL